MKAVILAAGYATRLYPLTLDRPKALNAFDSPLYRAAAAALEAARSDDAVKVVVITGAGRAFSAGQDLDEMARLAASVLDHAGSRIIEASRSGPANRPRELGRAVGLELLARGAADIIERSRPGEAVQDTA
jgi:enoyl-CoA hydratase/carnithine racemase